MQQNKKRGKKCHKLDRPKLDPAPVTKTWWKQSLKGSLGELLPQHPCAISPETQKSSVLSKPPLGRGRWNSLDCSAMGVCTPSWESLSTDLWHEQDPSWWCITLQSTVLFTEATRWFKIPKPHWKSLEIRHFEKSTLLKTSFNLLNYSRFWKLYSC